MATSRPMVTVIDTRIWTCDNCGAEFVGENNPAIYDHACIQEGTCTTPTPQPVGDEGHSPLPWGYDVRCGFVMDGKGLVVAQMWDKAGDDFNNAEANGRAIVVAVNTHASLLERVAELERFVEYVREFYQASFDVMPVAFQTVDNEAEALLRDER